MESSQARSTYRPDCRIDVFSETLDSAGVEGELNLSDNVWSLPTGIQARDAIRLLINDTASDFTVAGVIDGRAGEAVLMDLEPATRLFRRGGKLDRILIEAPSSHSMEDWVELLRRRLPEASRSLGRARKPTRTVTCWKPFAGTCGC